MKYSLLLLVAIIYFFGVFCFALWYYKLFGDNTSCFIINSEFNEYVIQFNDLWTDDFVSLYSKKEVPIKMDLFNSLLSPYYDSLITIENEQKLIKKEIFELDNELNYLDSVRYIHHDINVEKARDSINHKLYLSRDSLQYEIEKIGPDSILVSDYKFNEDQLKVSKLKVKLSNLEIEIAKNNYEIAVSVANNFGFYDNDSIVNRLSEVYERGMSHKELSLDKNVLTTDLQSDVSWLIQDFHTSRYKKVKFIDLLYYSFTTSVASTYGDIIPNSRKVRIFTMIQLALSILLIGIIVGDITYKLTCYNK